MEKNTNFLFIPSIYFRKWEIVYIRALICSVFPVFSSSLLLFSSFLPLIAAGVVFWWRLSQCAWLRRCLRLEIANKSAHTMQSLLSSAAAAAAASRSWWRLRLVVCRVKRPTNECFMWPVCAMVPWPPSQTTQTISSTRFKWFICPSQALQKAFHVVVCVSRLSRFFPLPSHDM